MSHGGVFTCPTVTHPVCLMSCIYMYLDPRKLSLGKPVGENTPAAETQAPPRHRPGSEFLRGPIPLTWLCRAASLPGKALAIGLALWFKAGATKNRTVKLTGALAARFNVGRKAGARCLKALEAAGLISVVRHVGRCPVVTILDVDDPLGQTPRSD